jgi:hypothetical protein
MDMNPAKPGDTAQLMEQILYEVKRVVVGQDRFLERVMVAMLAQGHLLVEGVPGLAKTLTVKTLANTVRGQFKRIQFTPDLVPPTWSARASTTRRPATSAPRWGRCSPTCCWPTKSTARRPRCRARCWR